MMPMPMVTVMKLANGYCVRFSQPFERERVIPSQVPPGLLESQAAIAMALRSGDDDEEMAGAGAWEASRREEREARVREEITKVQKRLANQKVTQWVLEPQEYLAPTLRDVFALLQQADAAQDKTLALLRSGVVVHGVMPGTQIFPA